MKLEAGKPSLLLRRQEQTLNYQHGLKVIMVHLARSEVKLYYGKYLYTDGSNYPDSGKEASTVGTSFQKYEKIDM
jgi:hypothetical protein